MEILTGIFALLFFLGMLAFASLGRRLGLIRLASDPEGLERGASTAESAVLALLGLLLAFTFSGAASRLETRKELIVQEANDIGTAYLRLDILPPASQPAMRDLFRKYLDSRLATYSDVRDTDGVNAGLRESAALQAAIWNQGMAASQRPDAPPQAAMVLLPALNDMIDITTTRTMAARNHPPLLIFFLLAGMCFFSALLVGYGTSVNRKRRWMHVVIFSLSLTLTSYVILDVEYPRVGLIRVDSFDQALVDLRKSMG